MMGLRNLLIILAAICCLLFAHSAHAQPQAGDGELEPDEVVEVAQPLPTEPADKNELLFYAMLDDKPVRELGPIASQMQRFAPWAPNKRVATRPMLIWFHWANQAKPFIP